MNKEQRVRNLLASAIKEIESLKNDIELYRYVIEESNDWLIAGEGIDFTYHMDSEPNDKQLVNYILDSFNDNVMRF